MMNVNRLSAQLASLLVMGLLASGCESEEPFPSQAELELMRELHTMPRRPPGDTTNRLANSPEASALGFLLFEDPRLSSCRTVACKSCHDGEGKTVSEPTALGCNGNRTGRNPPSTLNADYNRWFMWDGRSDRLWNQAILPMTSPVEMDSNATIVREELQSRYLEQYQQLFGKSPAETGDDELLANVGKVLQAYERTTNRLDSPFDEDVKRFIAAADSGSTTLEDDPAYLGLKTYFRKGQCIICHKGVTMSDNLFHNIGVKDTGPGAQGQSATIEGVLDWKFNAKGLYSDDRNGLDASRIDSTRATLAEKRAEMEGAFKTPTLRNIALTAPYMHTGELATLEDVIELYNKGGEEPGAFHGTKTDTIKKLDLDSEEKAALVKLLESMTGAPATP
ncbi:MAG: cytochrome-c peroxidase [Myxococcaceae bacterium]|nr:cytochrome-c peroxidase [Myxococcaceae bacterium]